MTSLLQAVGSNAVNAEVKGKILELIQSWAGATENRYELSYIGEVYKTLEREGYQFPPKIAVASSMIDSSAVCQSQHNLHSPETWANSTAAAGMGRLRRLYAMQNRLYFHEPQAPLS